MCCTCWRQRGRKSDPIWGAYESIWLLLQIIIRYTEKAHSTECVDFLSYGCNKIAEKICVVGQVFFFFNI